MKRIIGSTLLGLVLIGALSSAAARSFADQAALAQARQLIASDKRDQAVKILRDLTNADPGNFDARVMLGTALAVQGVRSESIEQITEAVKLRPQSADAYNLLGTTLSRFMETEHAREAFERAIQLNPGMADAHVNLALLLAQAADWDGAGAHLDTALALQKNTPASAYTHYLRAKIWTVRTEFDKADEELEQAVRIKPNFAEAWSDLGAARRVISDDKGALRAFQKSVLLDPKDPLAQYGLGTAYLRNDEPMHAVQHLQAALKLAGPDKPTLYNLEVALRRTGDLQGAREVRQQMEDLLKAGRNSAESTQEVSKLNSEGMKLEQQGNFQGATAKYRAALDIDPTAEGIRLNYGLSLCRLRQWRDGIAEIQEVLRLDPDNGTAAKALFIAKEQAEADSKATARR